MSTRATQKQAIQPDSGPHSETKNKGAQPPRYGGLPYKTRRYQLLREYDHQAIQKARFTLAHLLLTEGSRVVDVGCGDGEQTYLMAALAPDIHFTGVDKSKRDINKAREHYRLENLEFKNDDAALKTFDKETVDAVINSDVLHEVYSSCRYNTRGVHDTLEQQFAKIKKRGLMFIRDYSRPPPNEMVMLELADETGSEQDLAHMSDVELLIWFAEHARPKQDPGCGGFFLEEVPARIPQTRLFRLEYKWAYEFMMRKDERHLWEKELPVEYTFFTIREFRKELRTLGTRVEYTSPYWDEEVVNTKLKGKVRLFDDNGKTLGLPPTCFVAVARKMAERKSLNIEERRPSAHAQSSLHINTMRNEKNGHLVEVVRRDIDVSEIIPYRVDEDGRLKLYLHDGIPRGLANSVPRNGMSVDGKRWSGHMVEAISVNSDVIASMEEISIKTSILFARDHLALKPENDAVLINGPAYYPAPDYIDEKIQTFFLNVRKSTKAHDPKQIVGASERFQAKGQVHEFDAQQVLNAITVGMIPNSRLELQILGLLNHLNITAEKWTDKDIILKAVKVVSDVKTSKLMRMITDREKRFREVKGTTGSLRPVHSTFVEEGQSQGSLSGLSAEDMDFVVREEHTMNTAVVIPLTKNMKDEVHAGALLEHLPVPQRIGGSSTTISAPSFDIPAHIKSDDEIRSFIADKFTVMPDMVIKLGESYFSHIGLTQQRIHPYAVAAAPGAIDNPDKVFMPFSQFRVLYGIKGVNMSPHFMTVIARSFKFLGAEIKGEAKLAARHIAKERFQGSEPDWGVPVIYESITDEPSSESSRKNDFTLSQKMDTLKAALNSQKLTPEDKAVLQQKISEYQEQKAVLEDTVLKQHAINSSEQTAPAPLTKTETPVQTPQIIPAKLSEGQLNDMAPQSDTQKSFNPLPSAPLALSQEFESEIDAFIEHLEETTDLTLRPEKW